MRRYVVAEHLGGLRAGKVGEAKQQAADRQDGDQSGLTDGPVPPEPTCEYGDSSLEHPKRSRGPRWRVCGVAPGGGGERVAG